MPEPLQDPTSLEFRRRLDRQPRRDARRGPYAPWVLVAAIAAVISVVLIRALPDRTANPAVPPVASTSGMRTAVDESVRDYPPVVTGMPMVYQCEGRSGAISLQSHPCAPDERTTRAVPAPPDIEPEPSRYATVHAPDGAINNGQIINFPAGDHDSAQRKWACAQARREREDTLARVGLKRTYDLLQRLDETVRRACKGQ